MSAIIHLWLRSRRLSFGKNRTATSGGLRRFAGWRYRDNEKLVPDIAGTEIADLETARIDAIKILAELARGIERPEHHVLSIEVRDDHKPLLQVSLTLDIKTAA